jgi:hypothetical protein
MGSLARLMAQPLEMNAASVIDTFDAEAEFLMGSWSRQHTLLAIPDHPSFRSALPTSDEAVTIRRDLGR